MGNLLIFLGLIFVIFGVILKFGIILPGDILIKKGGFVFYFPIVTSILISIILTLIFWIFGKLK